MKLTRVIAVAVVIAAGAARADDARDREDAKREFAAGQAADRDHDWQAAIDHYLRANDLVPHPNTMFNIAADYERLGKLPEAASWYQRYVDAAPASPDRDRVIRRRRELARRPARLSVRSSPSDATLRIDGREVGRTPYDAELPGGPHDLEIERDGVRAGRRIQIEFGEPLRVDLALRAPTGLLRVTGGPPGATVILDGKPAGATPLAIPVPAGEHAIRVEHPEHQAFETRVTIAADRETVVEAKLPRALGTFGDAKKRVIEVGYLFGGAGGIDARNATGFGLLEVGVRRQRFDASLRWGTYGDLRSLDLLVRWAVTARRIAPFLSGGYAFVYDPDRDQESAGGYLLTGGVRFDLSRGEHVVVSMLAEAGIRFVAVSSTQAEDEGTPGLIVPVMTTLQVTYR